MTTAKVALDEVQTVLQYVFVLGVGFVVSVSGVVSNVFNAVIFWSQGLKDSMSVALLALSVADFLATVLHLGTCTSYLVDVVYPDSPINGRALGNFAFGWIMNAMYLTSCWITAMITIERCFCVVSPFKVKLVFTRFRGVVAILIIYIANIGADIPIYIIHKMKWVDFGVGNNLTRKVFTTVSDSRSHLVEMIFDAAISCALSDLLLVVVAVSAIWMMFALRATTQVRTAAYLHMTDSDSPKPQPKMSPKERKLVKVTLTVAISFLVFSLPRVVISIVYNSIPTLQETEFSNISIILWSVTYIFSSARCTAPIFVYLVLNSQYRRLFNKLLGCSCTKTVQRCVSH